MKNKKPKKDYLQDLFLLRIFYSKIIEIFNVMKSGLVMYDDLVLNQCYISLTNRINNILNKKEFKKLKNTAPEIYDNLLGISEELDHYWEFLKSDLLYFFGKIERQCIANNVQKYKLPKEIEDFVKSLDLAIYEHNKKVERGTKEFYKEAERLSKNSKKNKKTNQKIEFFENECFLGAGNKKCQLPPFKNEHFFCVSAYEYPIGEPIDWSILYEKMTGYYKAYYGKPPETRENWRLVYDTMKRLNKRIEETLGIKNLFTWQEKTIKRNY